MVKRIKPFHRYPARQFMPIVAVAAIAGIGVYLLNVSHAATSYVSATASSGTLLGTAASTTDATATADKRVVFGTTASTSGIPAPPIVSSNSLYPLEQTTTFAGNSLPSILQDYGDEILPPSGYIASSHEVLTGSALEIKGYPDSISGNVGGATGAGFDLSDLVPSSGGFDVCFSMSAGNWQNVHLVLISWPADNNWDEGENDFFEGNPQDMEINVHQIGNNPADAVYQSTWPAALVGGVHVVSVRWDPVNGYRYYLDGTLVTTASVSASVTTPTTPHYLAIQMQDMSESSTSSETATIYWTARYGYQ